MPSVIHVLPEALANQIAAGEVVERPASVVKELLENSLDAGCRTLDITVQDAGFTLIGVSDDGSGMVPEDARLAFQRHATSKLRRAEDLEGIQTLGFRGEALPSIASVSRLTLVTRPADQVAGSELVWTGGTLQSSREAGCPPGTQVKVEDLFYNTPARKKFMKSKPTEQGHLIEVVEAAALAHPQVRFRLRVDGKEWFNLPVAGTLRERLAALYGASLPELLPFELADGDLRVSGFISVPEAARPTRHGMRFFINQRPIEHRGLAHAVIAGFRPLLPEGRFPTCFVFVDLPADQVDVNVHPAKREVKLQNERPVHDLLQASVQASLVRSSGLRAPSEPLPMLERGSGETGYLPLDRPGWSAERVRESVAEYLTQGPGDHRSRSWTPTAANDPVNGSLDRVLGQVGRTFIVAQDQHGLMVLDQHAAHERLLYEQWLQRKGPVGRQALLVPPVLDLPPSLLPHLQPLLEFFAERGFELAPFGGNSVLVQTQPEDYRGEIGPVILSVLEEVAHLGTLPNLDRLREELWESMACHAAVKAGDRLQPEVMDMIFRGVQALETYPACPHGRPFVYRIRWDELDRFFQRT